MRPEPAGKSARAKQVPRRLDGDWRVMRACNIFVSRIAPFGADEMAHRAFWTWIPLAALLLTGTPAAAQFPDKFTNLKVLPKDISKHEMESTMRSFAFALGVRCDH